MDDERVGTRSARMSSGVNLYADQSVFVESTNTPCYLVLRGIHAISRHAFSTSYWVMRDVCRVSGQFFTIISLLDKYIAEVCSLKDELQELKKSRSCSKAHVVVLVKQRVRMELKRRNTK